MKSSIKTVLLTLALGGTCGCASIVSGGPQSLPLHSSPPGATCEVSDGRSGAVLQRATAPTMLTLQRDAGFWQPARYRVRCSHPGYRPYETQLVAGMNPWYFGNIVFGGLVGILLVDPATGAMWKIEEQQVNAVLVAEIEGSPSGQDALAVSPLTLTATGGDEERQEVR